MMKMELRGGANNIPGGGSFCCIFFGGAVHFDQMGGDNIVSLGLGGNKFSPSNFVSGDGTLL